MTATVINTPADRCPLCGGDTKVTDTRPTEASLRRRRCCLVCAHRYTTYEVVSADDAKDGALVMFSKRRLTSLRHALSSIDRIIGGGEATKRERKRRGLHAAMDIDLDQPTPGEPEASP